MHFLKVVCMDKLAVGTKKPSKCLFTLIGLQVILGGYYNLSMRVFMRIDVYLQVR